MPEPCVVIHMFIENVASTIGADAMRSVQVHDALAIAICRAQPRTCLRLLLREFAEQLRGAIGDVVIDLERLARIRPCLDLIPYKISGTLHVDRAKRSAEFS